MPLYEYGCPKCKKTKTLLQSIKDGDRRPTCKKCKIRMKRIISKSSFRLHGSGFYQTDYKKRPININEDDS